MNIVNENSRNYFHSRLLNVHRHSIHPEVTKFINHIYNESFRSYYNDIEKKKVNHSIRKRHLKVILLDLYIAWSNDPNLNIAVHMNKNSYNNGAISNRSRSRYNELDIKDTMIKIIRRLQELGLIGIKRGWNDKTGKALLSRIWSEKKLTFFFQDALFNEFDIDYRDDKEVVILRDKKKNELRYTDTSKTFSMRKLLTSYNALICKTFIDIPNFNKSEVIISSNISTKDSVFITQHNKFVERVFNKSNWNNGSIFVGGWWQKINKEHRKNIWINNKPTVEISYETIPIIRAYYEKDIDYWATTAKDPYDIPLPNTKFQNSNVENVKDKDARKVVKLFCLLSLAAANKTSAFQAFVNEWDYKKYPYTGVFKHNYLEELLKNIKKAHPAIADLLCSGTGTETSDTHSRIIEHIVQDCVNRSTPILIIHDSFIIECGQESRLENLIKEICQILKKDNSSENKSNVTSNKSITLPSLNHSINFEKTPGKDISKIISNITISDGYKQRLTKHNQYFKGA